MDTEVCLAVMEYNSPRVFENRMGRKIFWAKRERK
jgi:hypothetical protein